MLVVNCGRAFSRFDFTPVVILLLIEREFAHCRELHALRYIRYRFPLRSQCRADAPAEVADRRVGKVDVQRTD
jgi:hypothetical protein